MTTSKRSARVAAAALAAAVTWCAAVRPAIALPAAKAHQAAAGKSDRDTRIDLNRATVARMEKLPGIGPALAKKIAEGRPYASLSELSRAGISAATIEKIRPLVRLTAVREVP